MTRATWLSTVCSITLAMFLTTARARGAPLAIESKNLSSARVDANGRIHLEMQMVEIREVARYFSGLLGRDFIVPPSLMGYITLTADSDVSVEEALDILRIRLDWDNLEIGRSENRYYIETSDDDWCESCHYSPLHWDIAASFFHIPESRRQTLIDEIEHRCSDYGYGQLFYIAGNHDKYLRGGVELPYRSPKIDGLTVVGTIDALSCIVPVIKALSATR